MTLSGVQKRVGDSSRGEWNLSWYSNWGEYMVWRYSTYTMEVYRIGNREWNWITGTDVKCWGCALAVRNVELWHRFIGLVARMLSTKGDNQNGGLWEGILIHVWRSGSESWVRTCQSWFLRRSEVDQNARVNLVNCTGYDTLLLSMLCHSLGFYIGIFWKLYGSASCTRASKGSKGFYVWPWTLAANNSLIIWPAAAISSTAIALWPGKGMKLNMSTGKAPQHLVTACGSVSQGWLRRMAINSFSMDISTLCWSSWLNALMMLAQLRLICCKMHQQQWMPWC